MPFGFSDLAERQWVLTGRPERARCIARWRTELSYNGRADDERTQTEVVYAAIDVVGIGFGACGADGVGRHSG